MSETKNRVSGWTLRDAGWQVASTGEKLAYLVNNNTGRASALLRSDGEYALRAVNAHEALVSALRAAQAALPTGSALQRVEDALRLAEGS